mmetsp:Transcript_3507/g.7092  ORF Transcript_3507/g.7092 Transcript_3507/m.7092 type:complete len:82 (-) Transcript_3507:304-549(-)
MSLNPTINAILHGNAIIRFFFVNLQSLLAIKMQASTMSKQPVHRTTCMSPKKPPSPFLTNHSLACFISRIKMHEGAALTIP